MAGTTGEQTGREARAIGSSQAGAVSPRAPVSLM
jgi:hypothetical protein